MSNRKRPAEMKWSEREKQIATLAVREAYIRECLDFGETVRKLAAGFKAPNDVWVLLDYMTDVQKEMDEKYDPRHSVLPVDLARLMSEGWITEEDLAGLSEDKLQQIREAAKILDYI